MAERDSNKQYIFLGEIGIAPDVTALMNSDQKFHNNIYHSIMLHETGECRREFTNAGNNGVTANPSDVKSTHSYDDYERSILIKTDLRKSVTYIQFNIQNFN